MNRVKPTPKWPEMAAQAPGIFPLQSAQTTAVPRRQARAAGIENASGAMITAFEPHGPAALAGLMSLDTIVQLNGLPITGVDDLIRNLNGERINRVTMIDVLRRGQLCSFDVKPLERPASAPAASAR